MIVDLAAIKAGIMPEIRAHALVGGEQDVNVEADQDLDGHDFLRVMIRLPKRDIPDATLEALLESIEERVAGMDDRYVSVRYEDAV